MKLSELINCLKFYEQFGDLEVITERHNYLGTIQIPLNKLTPVKSEETGELVLLV